MAGPVTGGGAAPARGVRVGSVRGRIRRHGSVHDVGLPSEISPQFRIPLVEYNQQLRPDVGSCMQNQYHVNGGLIGIPFTTESDNVIASGP